MSRYYSQPYARLDDPDWNPDPDPSVSAENINNAPYEPYRSYAAHADDDVPLTQTKFSNYIDSRYPPRGIRGLKQKGKSWLSFWSEWSRRKQIIVVSSIVAAIIIIAIIIGAVVATTGSSFSYTQSFVKVTNEKAFSDGGASKEIQNHDGVGSGEDKYVYYSGDASEFPPSDQWVSFQNMWTNNRPTIEGSCSTLGDGQDDTPEEIDYIFQAIKNRSTVSLVDHRFILAVILQESQGCIHVGQTTSSSGVTNPGLMQSHDGHSFNSDNPSLSILAMVQDGTQGTKDGAGLVQGLNLYGNVYEAARYYNSGKVGQDLSKTDSGTPCYVSDVANRLTGWVRAKNECPDQ